MRTLTLVMFAGALAVACRETGTSSSADGAIADRPAQVDRTMTAPDGGTASDTGGADATGTSCYGQICAPGTMCCPNCEGTAGSCSFGGCPGVACPPLVDARPAADGPSCSDKAPACGTGMVCDLDQPNRCGASTVGGTCIVRPTACTRIFDPVCGCDGRSYGNDCTRQMAGAQLDHRGACNNSSQTEPAERDVAAD